MANARQDNQKIRIQLFEKDSIDMNFMYQNSIYQTKPFGNIYFELINKYLSDYETPIAQFFVDKVVESTEKSIAYIQPFINGSKKLEDFDIAFEGSSIVPLLNFAEKYGDLSNNIQDLIDEIPEKIESFYLFVTSYNLPIEKKILDEKLNMLYSNLYEERDKFKNIKDSIDQRIAIYDSFFDKEFKIDKALLKENLPKLEKNLHDFFSLNIKYDNKIFHFADEVDSFLIDSYNQIKNEYNISFSLAEKMKKLSQSSNALDFIRLKEGLSTAFYETQELTGKYEKVYFFKDNSVLFKTKEGYEAPISLVEIKNNLKSILEASFDDVIKNHPHVKKEYIKKLSSSFFYHDHNKALLSAESYATNVNALKAADFDIIQSIKETKGFEELDDKINKTLKEHKIKQYANSILSNKYRYLYTEKSYEIFKELYELEISNEVVRSNIGAKLAAFKTSENFNTALDQLLCSLNGFTPESIKQRVNAAGAEIVYDYEGQLLVKVDSFAQCKRLGSASWCIARDEHYFESYTNGNASQYILYDFNLTSQDNHSMIGMTYSKNTIEYAHLKDDTQAELAYCNQLYKSIIEQSLNQDRDHKIRVRNNHQTIPS